LRRNVHGPCAGADAGDATGDTAIVAAHAFGDGAV